MGSIAADINLKDCGDVIYLKLSPSLTAIPTDKRIMLTIKLTGLFIRDNEMFLQSKVVDYYEGAWQQLNMK